MAESWGIGVLWMRAFQFMGLLLIFQWCKQMGLFGSQENRKFYIVISDPFFQQMRIEGLLWFLSCGVFWNLIYLLIWILKQINNKCRERVCFMVLTWSLILWALVGMTVMLMLLSSVDESRDRAFFFFIPIIPIFGVFSLWSNFVTYTLSKLKFPVVFSSSACHFLCWVGCPYISCWVSCSIVGQQQVIDFFPFSSTWEARKLKQAVAEQMNGLGFFNIYGIWSWAVLMWLGINLFGVHNPPIIGGQLRFDFIPLRNAPSFLRDWWGMIRVWMPCEFTEKLVRPAFISSRCEPKGVIYWWGTSGCSFREYIFCYFLNFHSLCECIITASIVSSADLQLSVFTYWNSDWRLTFDIMDPDHGRCWGTSKVCPILIFFCCLHGSALSVAHKPHPFGIFLAI